MKRMIATLTVAAALVGGGAIATPSSAATPSAMAKAKAKESKADASANVAANRDVIQSLEHSKKVLEGESGKDVGGHRASAILLIQKAMGEIRAQTSKPGH